MSKFLLASGDRIKHVEKPILVGEIYDALWPLSNMGPKHHLLSARVAFDVPRVYINDIICRGNCCLLVMMENFRDVQDRKMIDTAGRLWGSIPPDRNLNVFHYRHDLSVVRPVLLISFADDVHFQLGGPVEHRLKIIKGQYSE